MEDILDDVIIYVGIGSIVISGIVYVICCIMTAQAMVKKIMQ